MTHHDRDDQGQWTTSDEPIVTRTGRTMSDAEIEALSDAEAARHDRDEAEEAVRMARWVLTLWEGGIDDPGMDVAMADLSEALARLPETFGKLDEVDEEFRDERPEVERELPGDEP